MASKGNQTCVHLQNVARTGMPHHTTSLIIKGTWYPQHFALAVTDGLSAWRIDATEPFVIQRATDLKLTAAQFVDAAHLHLGHKSTASLYSLHITASGGGGVHLLCTPRDGRDLLTDSTLNLPLVAAPALELAFEMLQFLMLAYQDLTEESERKTRAFERTRGDIEELQRQNALLQHEKTQLELKVLSIKDGDQLAIVTVPSSSTGLKRKMEPAAGTGGEQVKKRRGRPPGKSCVGAAAAAAEGELSGCDGEWKKTVVAKTGKKRGRKPKGATVVQLQDQTLPLVRPFGGAQTTSLTRDVGSEHRIDEQSERAIKLLEPYTRQLAARKPPANHHLKPFPLARQPSEDTSTQSSVALIQQTPKEFSVINADFYDFDNERSKYVMGLGQYWALYDNHDGMPRFYGRIVSLTLEPFAVDVEWLEPHRPGAAPALAAAHLSVSCGEFKRDSISAQTLAAFSHRVEVEADARRKTYRIFPRKGDVWAVYKHPPLRESKLEYELVEVLSEVCKERGVKVGPVTKVPGFRTVFRSGGAVAPRWIPMKDLQAVFSHQIATHRFDGSETRVVPRGSFGLDSASTPEEFLSSCGRSFDVPAVKVMQTISESG